MSNVFHWLIRHLITDRMLVNELKHRGYMEFTITTASGDVGRRVM